ncbi:MAG TPA: undecaprenyl-diphosphate phosphatase, partial [Opitutae bacterium]|nr:undecaprenyl-diphosphate phosphatase [Opitutae bacterium]
LLDDIIEEKLFNPTSVCIALVAGGILMLGTEYWKKRSGKEQSELSLHELSISKCLMIGFLQCIAMWPGTSRSMMTIVGGYYAGLRPALAAEFSFLLGLITLSAASGYKALTMGKALLILNAGPLLFGIIVATISAALAVKFLVHVLTRYGLSAFAYYRIVLAGGILLALS